MALYGHHARSRTLGGGAVSERPMSAEGPLRPNPDAMHDFLAFWFHDCTRGVVEIGSIVPGTRSLSVFERFGLDDLESAAEYAALTNKKPGASVYFRASTINEEAEKGRTSDSDVCQTPGIWGDHDSEASVSALSNNPLPFKPPAWIITGTVPFMRVQSFWRLSEPLTNLDMVRDLNQRLISVFRCDTTTYNPSRLMRLPGSIAWPIKAGRSIAELTTWQRGDNRPSALPVHQVAFTLPKLAEAPPAAATDTASSFPPPDPFSGTTNTPARVSQLMEWARTAPQPGQGGHWHETVLRLVAHWVGRGLSNAEILAMAGQLTAPGYSADQTRREMAPMLDGARKKWAVPDEDGTIEPAGVQNGRPAIWIDAGAWDEEAIPKRPWIAPSYLMRNAVSCLSGQGSGGKSSLVVCWTISLALGEAVGEFRPSGPCVVVNYNVEDDEQEQQRRYSAALKAIQKAPADIAGKVIRCGPRTIGTLFERDNNTGRIVPTKALEALESLLMETGADALVCDPLAELHNAEENDNTAMRSVVAAFRGLAQRLGIAVLLLHHDRKGNNAPGDMDRLRGASAITGAVRVLVTLTSMSVEEAEQFGIPPEERRRHFRIDGAKSNYAVAQEAEWWKLAGYALKNGEEVAACRPWTPPSMFDGLSMADCVEVLDSLNRGHPSGLRWGYDSRAKDQWAGVPLMEKGRTKPQAKSILYAWKESQVIETGEAEGSRRGHDREAVISVNPHAVAGMRHQIRGAGSHVD